MEFKSFNDFYETFHELLRKSRNMELIGCTAIFPEPYSRATSYAWDYSKSDVSKAIFQSLISMTHRHHEMGRLKNPEYIVATPRTRQSGINSVFIFERETLGMHVNLGQVQLSSMPKFYATFYEFLLAVQVRWHPKVEIGTISISFSRIFEYPEDFLPLRNPEFINRIKPFGLNETPKKREHRLKQRKLR